MIKNTILFSARQLILHDPCRILFGVLIGTRNKDGRERIGHHEQKQDKVQKEDDELQSIHLQERICYVTWAGMTKRRAPCVWGKQQEARLNTASIESSYQCGCGTAREYATPIRCPTC